MFPIQMECKLGVIHLGGFPAVRCMTGSALGTKLALMRVILGVAGTAVLRRAFEDSVDMAFLASHCGVFAVKMECEQGMIHLRIFPAFGRMTRCAVGSKLTVVMVIFLMAGETRL